MSSNQEATIGKMSSDHEATNPVGASSPEKMITKYVSVLLVYPVICTYLCRSCFPFNFISVLSGSESSQGIPFLIIYHPLPPNVYFSYLYPLISTSKI